MTYSYIIITDSQENASKIQGMASEFRSLTFLASAANYNDGLNIILKHQPHLLFLEIDPENKESGLSLSLIGELYQYL
ncbi:MAG TPA: DNA-binding response regulator, partial [Flavobacterium sp.]|nr:DNA-binding response regulator [Flavobacterium sp.]